MYLVSKRIARVCGLMLLVLFVAGITIDNVYGYDGEGNDTYGYDADCSTFVNGLVSLCGSRGSGGGGASWHIYRLSDLNDSGANRLNQKPYLDYQILDDVVTINTIKNSCGRVGADWVAVYGWEGSVSKGNGNILTGPAKRKGTIGSAQYNSYNAMSWKNLEPLINSGINIPHNRRITLEAAQQLHRRAGGGTAIASNVGYFCFDSGTSFQGKARAISGTIIGEAEKTNDSGWWNTANSVKTAGSENPLTVDCSSGSCKASFIFDLRRMQSNSLRTDYVIYRRVGSGSWTKMYSKKAEDNYVLQNSGGGTSKIVYRNAETMKPGGKTICYKMVFGVNTKNNETSTVQTCVKPSGSVSDQFRGRIRVFDYIRGDDGEYYIDDDTLKTTGFVNVNKDNELFVKECSMEGCSITFSLDLIKDEDKNIETSYIVRKYKNGKKESVNYEDIQFKNGINHRAYIKDGDVEGTLSPRFRSGNGSASVYWASEKMRPGDEVCYILKFETRTGNNSPKPEIGGCAVVVGAMEATTTLDEFVKNDNVENDYKKEVYAKPGDSLTYKTIYEPGAQSMIDLTPARLIIKDASTVIANVVNTENDTMKSLFNKNRGDFAEINNDFMVRGIRAIGLRTSEFSNYTYGSKKGLLSVGDDKTKQLEDYYKVGVLDVGHRLIERAETNPDNDMGVWTTPSRVGFNAGDDDAAMMIDISGIESSAVAEVPYNFVNTIKMNTDKMIYAGENIEANYEVQVGKRINETTQGDYATIVRDARIQVVMCEGQGCTNNNDVSPVIDERNIILNSSGNMDGYSDPGEHKTISIPDVPAGTQMCFRARVYPKKVINDITITTEWNDDDFGYDWAESEEQCYSVAKRPSFQVWGGGIYSAGVLNLEKTLANKITLDGYGSGMYVFGPWAELSLVAEGEVRGLASGAGLGYGTTTDAGNASHQKTIETLGGRDNSDYCLMSTLSIANSNCNSAVVGNLGRSSGRSGDKSSLLSDFAEEIGANYKVFSLGNGTFSIKDKFGELKGFNGEEITDGENTRTLTTKIIKADGDVTIDTDITYENNGYSNLESIPKIIIYAKNINISCSVMRIDAVLIADEKINTCSDNITDNSSLRSTPLMIRGSVISDTLTLGRTYGAATGKNSVIPAEIINYDTSLYLWANNQSSATTSGKLTETYINELAPRY